MKLKREEITRKLLHVLTGTVILLGIIYIPVIAAQIPLLAQALDVKWYPAIVLAISMVGFASVEFIRLRVPAAQQIFHKYFGSMLRHEESVRMTGATWINVSALICSVVFVDSLHIAAIVLSLFIWGDAAAALVGQSIGKIKIGKKSLEGTLACFALCVGVFLLLFPRLPLLLDAWNGHVPLNLVFIISACIAILELVPMKISTKFTLNDNLVVPVVAGLIMLWLYPFVQ